MDKILVFGGSIVYGKWDAEGGWVARLREYIDTTINIPSGKNIQVYNLGIPGETAVRLVERFDVELKMRIFEGEKSLVILAIGVNDSCVNNWMTGMQTSEIDFKHIFETMIEKA